MKLSEEPDHPAVVEPKLEAGQEDYPCDICDSVLTSSADFIAHTNSEHSDKVTDLLSFPWS